MERAGAVSGRGAGGLLVLENSVVLPVIDIGPEGVDRDARQREVALQPAAGCVLIVRAMQHQCDGIFIGSRIGTANAVEVKARRGLSL